MKANARVLGMCAQEEECVFFFQVAERDRERGAGV